MFSVLEWTRGIHCHFIFRNYFVSVSANRWFLDWYLNGLAAQNSSDIFFTMNCCSWWIFRAGSYELFSRQIIPPINILDYCYTIMDDTNFWSILRNANNLRHFLPVLRDTMMFWLSLSFWSYRIRPHCCRFLIDSYASSC